MQVQGIIETMSAKELFTGRMKSPANIYSFKVTGDNNWYKTGFKQPSAVKGNNVSFEAVETQHGWTVEATAIRVLSEAEEPTTINKASTMSKDDYWKKREDRDAVVQATIQYQAARNASIAALSAALDAGILSLPSAKNKQLDAYLLQIDEVTEKYFTNINIDKEDETTLEDDMYATEEE